MIYGTLGSKRGHSWEKRHKFVLLQENGTVPPSLLERWNYTSSEEAESVILLGKLKKVLHKKEVVQDLEYEDCEGEGQGTWKVQ